MKRFKLTTQERQSANRLRDLILDNSQNIAKKSSIEEFKNLITSPEPTVSPIMALNEDEIIMLVEQNDVEVLKNLSVAELNYIGEVLGIEPKILVEGLE